MARFRPQESYLPDVSSAHYKLLPIRFERLKSGKLLVTNFVGDWLLLSEADFLRLTNLEAQPGDGLFESASSKLLIAEAGHMAPLQLLALRTRSRLAFLQAPTPLHIFVVSLRCEHSCPYCQVSRRSSDVDQFDMSRERAEKALKIALSAPSPAIKIEFQGGEPLLNFPLIEFIVCEAERLAPAAGKNIQFVITSNLALLTEDILAFCKSHDILLSTSLDGPADLHNKNRPRPGGNSHELATAGIRRAKAVLGPDRVGALMTTTEASLDRVEEIVDEYVSLGMDGIFLRPLSPYGFAVKTKQFGKYDMTRWTAFYERGLNHIIEKNRRGLFFPETYARLLLQRLLTDVPIGYVDLRSPAGTGLGALVYNYDGRVFAADEGRMLAEMGDETFVLGHVDADDYRSIILSDRLTGIVASSLSQTAPQCSSCAFEPHCGADPVYHYATQGDPVGLKPLSGFCERQTSVLSLLIEMLEAGGDKASILRSWGTA